LIYKLLLLEDLTVMYLKIETDS